MASEFFFGRPSHQTEYALRRTFATHRAGASNTAISLIIGANATVFGAWMYADTQRDAGLLHKLSNNFTSSIRNLQEHRYWTLLTSAFSHRDYAHFGFNMVNLWVRYQLSVVVVPSC